MAKRGLGKALERKMGLDDKILTKVSTKNVKQSLLMNPRRLGIFEFICNNPSSHLRQIARSQKVSQQTAKWHLQKLSQAGLVSSFRFGKTKAFVPFFDLVTPSESRVLALFYRDDTRLVFNHVKANPGSNQIKLQKALGIYQQRLSRILLILEHHGLVSQKRTGRNKAYYVTDCVHQIIRSFDDKKARLQVLLMDALRGDGVAPEPVDSDPVVFAIEIDVSGNRRYTLKIHKNPALALVTGR